MGLFDYLFDPRYMADQGQMSGGYLGQGAAAKAGTGGMFDGLFSAPPPGNPLSANEAWNALMGGVSAPGMNGIAQMPSPPPGMSAYSEPAPAPQLPPGADPTTGVGAPREGAPGYYGGAPETNPLLMPRGQPPQRAQGPMPPQVVPQQGVPSGQPPIPLVKRGPTFPSLAEMSRNNPSIGDRLSSGVGGFFGAGNVGSGIVNLLGGLVTGQRTDPRGMAEKEAARMFQFLQTKEGGSLSPNQAQSVIMNPDLAKEYYKGLASGQPVFAPDGTILMPGGFGQPPQVVGSAAKPEQKERYNPQTGRMELTAVTPPTIGNPRMGVTTPGGPVLPGQGAGAKLPGQADAGVSFATAPSIEEKKTQEGIAEGNVKDFNEIQRQALAASGQKTIFQRMRQLNAMPNLAEGQLAPIQQTFRSAMVSLGIGDASKVVPGEEFNALANGLVLEMAGGSLGTGFSNADREFIVSRISTLQNTKAGREEMLNTLELLAQRKVEIAKEAVKYRAEHSGSLNGFQTYTADWAEKNPLFKDRPAMSTVGGPSPANIPPPPKGFVVQ